MTFETDLPGINRLVRFKIVQRSAGAPRPGAQCAPVIYLPRLAPIREANYSLRQPGAVVRLNRNRDHTRITPTLGQDLLLPGGTGWGRRRARQSKPRRKDKS